MLDYLDYIKGMDISSLDEIERLGAKFYDDGKEGDLIEILKRYGVNYIRLRLWNDPKSPEGEPYGALCRDASHGKAREGSRTWIFA